MEEVICSSEQETTDLARKIARKTSTGDVICLKGELGAGKTHFVKGFVAVFGIPAGSVSSPTFSIINEYIGNVDVYHFDFYRLEDPREALEIGAEEYFYGNGVSIVEWPERVEPILPDHTKWIEIRAIDSSTRRFRILQNR